MDNVWQFGFLFVVSGLLSWILTRLMIKAAFRFGLLDYPRTSRKIHSAPMPLGGGLAIYFSFFIIILILWLDGQLLDNQIDPSLIIWFLLAGFILIIGGILDDKFNLPPKLNILAPILASGLIIYFGHLEISHITNPLGGVLDLTSFFNPLVLGFITFLWLMAMTYTVKLLDGIDGLASSIGLIASSVIFIVSLFWDVRDSTTSLLAIVLAGVLLGFLFWNFYPAKIFLGEAGSVFIGFALGVLSVISGSKVATALLVMGLPFLDVLGVIIGRLRQGKPIWRADSQHLHFRLLLAGFSQKQVVGFFCLTAFAFGIIALLFASKVKIMALAILVLFMVILSMWLNHRIKK